MFNASMIPVFIHMSDNELASNLGAALAKAWRCFHVFVNAGDSFDSKNGAIVTDPVLLPQVLRDSSQCAIFCFGETDPDPKSKYIILNPKYGARQVGAVILSAFPESAFSAEMKESDLFIILVTGTRGGIGVSAIATTLAKILARENRVFYFSLEPYVNGTKYFMPSQCGENAESMLFDVCEGKKSIQPERYTCLDYSGVRYCESNGQFNEWRCCSADEEKIFLNAMRDSLCGGYLILDMPCFSPYIFKTAQKASNLVIEVETGVERATNCPDLFQAETGDFSGISTPILHVVNLARESDRVNIALDEDDIVIPYDPESIYSDADGIEINLLGGFGCEVEEIAERIREVQGKREIRPEKHAKLIGTKGEYGF